MRSIVLLLLLANLALFGYFKFNEPHAVEVVVGHEAIQSDKLKILTAEELASMPKKNASVPEAAPPPQPAPVQTACYQWGSFPKNSVSRAKNILEKFSLQSELQQATSQDSVRYWVYIPPLPNAEKAQAKNDEVRALGVQESFVVQEPQWRNAISLGVFKDEALAASLLNDVRARGVKSAIKGLRNHESGQSSYLIRNVTDTVAEEIGKLQPDFPGSELKKVPCP